ncbi:alpha-ketoacid dehydrogenase subunit alpha/beta [Pleionea sp. CnH1-48]|uniref:dehydrogenase E1 component subunit alpha/beta n=1 Tax=Pleionea sp. CnH1-48 TaxID=2954494 RepID=UPI002096EC47|nr:alpha-ketoacid dehydrogenase subunit alpha/beta [Pleionea sp. CnH1-48]MCO7224964.1 thiamine pyrophosphate-dependent enzyme [Pleionea sp. CnH1-48]
MSNRADIIHENFCKSVLDKNFPEDLHKLTPQDVGLTSQEVVELFESQAISRHLDFASRKLAARKESFYTIGSAGHEGNAVLGKVFRYTDMAFLHYRSCAFVVQRSRQVDGETPVYDTLLSFSASNEDPISAGRHKVLGSKALYIPPQTSTIASHLPKAMGAAYSIGLANKIKSIETDMPADSVVVCNFGDASANHSTALGAFNAAGWAAYQKTPMPIVFVCEDNGIGISTRTPEGWIQANFQHRAGFEYIYCDGLNILDVYQAAKKAERYARVNKMPVFLHCKTIRLMGHAGSDAEVSYRSVKEIEAIEAQDPLLHTARILVENDILTPTQVCQFYQDIEKRIARVAEEAITKPKLTTAEEVMASIAPQRNDVEPMPLPTAEQRNELFAKDKRQFGQPLHMSRHISLALSDILLQYPNTIVCGEDVGKKGGVYGATMGLHAKFGPSRVVNTLLDEQSILGAAIGLAHNGFLPIPEIQFLAYVHNAEDQIRGEAATLSFFSNGQYSNPMIVRIAGLAYQKGFGGHFHNDNSFNVFRDIPGVIIACPSNGRDAAKMLRTCVALAHEQKRVIIFIEPIALYMTRDLHEPEDGLWASPYEAPGEGEDILLGDLHIEGDGKDLCILTYGNGYYLSRQAAKHLEEKNIRCRVVDLRWLAPLNEAEIINAVAGCEHILVVDECRKTGSISEAIMTCLAEHNIDAPFSRIAAEDSFIPLAAAANLVLPSCESIVEAALELTNKKTQHKKVSNS